MPEMPLYVSHKEVRAAKIVGINYDLVPCNVTISFADGAISIPNHLMHHKPTPSVGWYYVEYGGEDNYFSFSPGDKFEEGYTLKYPPPVANTQVQ